MHGKFIVVSRAALQHGFKSQYYKNTRRDDRAKGVNISKSLQKRLAVELQDQAKLVKTHFHGLMKPTNFRLFWLLKENIFS